jgi:hypothetical protein
MNIEKDIDRLKNEECYLQIEKINQLITDFENQFKVKLYLWDYFDNIKNQIDIQRELTLKDFHQDEEKIVQINKHSEKLFKELEEFEKECYRYEASFEYKESIMKLNQRLKDLYRMDFDEKVIFIKEIKLMITNFEPEIEDYKSKLLMNKTLLFKPKKDDINFGKIIIKDNNLSIFEHTFEHTYLNTLNLYRECSPTVEPSFTRRIWNFVNDGNSLYYNDSEVIRYYNKGKDYF